MLAGQSKPRTSVGFGLSSPLPSRGVRFRELSLDPEQHGFAAPLDDVSAQSARRQPVRCFSINSVLSFYLGVKAIDTNLVMTALSFPAVAVCDTAGRDFSWPRTSRDFLSTAWRTVDAQHMIRPMNGVCSPRCRHRRRSNVRGQLALPQKKNVQVLATVSVGLTLVVMTSVSGSLVDKVGRRSLMLIGTLVMALALAILSGSLLWLNATPRAQGCLVSRCCCRCRFSRSKCFFFEGTAM